LTKTVTRTLWRRRLST